MRKRGHNKKDRILNIIMVVAILVFCFSGYQLYQQTKDYRTGGKEYEQVAEEAISIVEEPEENAQEETQEKIKEKKKMIDKTSFRVDFEKLRAINKEVVGWIRFDEPEIISYPLVQAEDNDKYLTATFEGNTNKVGAIFLDRVNASDFEDENTFIYGHNMKNGSMFGRLRKYKQESFYKQYPYFYIYTPEGKVYTYQIFSVEVTNDTSKSFQKEFVDNEDYRTYLEYLKGKSLFKTGVEVTVDSKMVSLSTCTNVTEEQRLIVHGVRVDIDKVK